MPALGDGRRPYVPPKRGKPIRPVKARRTPPRAPTRANVYVPPASLADPRERAAAHRAPRRYTFDPAKAKPVKRGPSRPIAGPSPDARDVSSRSPAQKRHDATVVAAVVKQARRDAIVHHRQGVVHDLLTGHAGSSTPPIASVKPSTAAVPIAAKVLSTIGREAGRAGKDAAEMAITLPSSLVHQGVEAAGAYRDLKSGHPIKAAKDTGHIIEKMAAPYVHLIQHPIKDSVEHPLQTALLVQPFVRAPGLAAGRVARAAGKQALRRPDATLPGTSLRERRTGSRDYVARKRQERRDAATPEPRISTTEKIGRPVPTLHRRVDEFADRAQQHHAAVQAAAGKQANERFGSLPKTERDAAIQSHMSGAASGARQHVQRDFAHEFGSHWQVGKGGTIIKPKNPPEHSGVIHATRDDAEKVADAIARRGHFEPHVKELEGATPGETAGFAVVPKAAHVRLGQHGNVGHAGWAVGPALRVTSRAFRKTVLPTSTKWLGGQVVEGAVRSAVHGGGPIPVVRYARGRKFLKAYEREHGKAAADDLRARTISSQQFGVTGPAAEFARHGPTVASEFADSGVSPHAQLVTDLADKPGVRHLRKGYRKYAETVFNDINGPIERFYKTGMLGKEVKRSPVMERRLVGLSADAMTEAAHGLHGTAAQVELGRGLDAAYGRYTKHGPTMRDTIMHTTPFIPWFLNMGRFLLRTLPRDHPIKAALAADVNAAEQDWRTKHRLSFHGAHVPPWLMGSYPTKGGKYAPAGRFMPFLPGEWTGAAAGQVYPQLFGILENLAGFNFKGQKIDGEGAKAANALLTAAESMVPGVAQVGRVTGLSDRYVRGQKKKESVVQGKSIGQGILDLINPVRATAEPATGKTRKKKQKKQKGGGGGYENLTGANGDYSALTGSGGGGSSGGEGYDSLR